MIEREQFEAYESVILSGQVPHDVVPGLLADNPDFALWYKYRAMARTHESLAQEA